MTSSVCEQQPTVTPAAARRGYWKGLVKQMTQLTLFNVREEAPVIPSARVAALGLVWIEPYLRHGPVANPARIAPVWDYEEE